MKRIQMTAMICAAVLAALTVLTGAAYAVANPPLCPHINGWNNGAADWAYGAPWIKVLDSGQIAPAKARAAYVFYRPYDAVAGGEDGCLPANMTGSQYADAVWAKIGGLAIKPDAVGYRNEFNWDNAPNSCHRRTCSEFVNYKNRLRALGYTGKVVFGSFGVGWVDSYVWDEPEVRAATDAADAIETHEYFDFTVACCSPWLCFRHRDLAINAHPDHLGTKEWFIGEWGSDRVCGNCPDCDDDLCRRGWRDRSKLSEQQYVDQMALYRQGCHPNVTAVFVFQQGDCCNWYDFETMNSAAANYMKSTWTAPPPVGNIAGNVKNTNGQNLQGATVTTSPGGYSANTDANGNYAISSIPTGTYSVTASKGGYQSSTQTGKTVNQGQTTTVNFVLSPVAGATELLTNGSFTLGCTGWSHSETPASIFWGCGYKEYPGTSAGNGGYGWNAYLACGGYWCDTSFTGELHQDNVSVNAGASYSASAQVYYEPVLRPGVAGDQKERLVLAFNNGTTHTSAWHTHTTVNGWDQITYSSTVPAGATSLTFKVELSHVDGQWSGTGAVDECSFYSTAPSCVAPSITTQPQSQTKCVGQSVTFSVVASGTGPFTYQWRKNGSNISGANASSYTIASVVSGDAANYSCVVTNACGTATSNNAALTVNVAPTITTHPTSQTKNVGESCTFTVAASGSTPLSYQWQKNAGNISGATAASYIIASVQSSDAGNYRCIVSNSCGSATSNAATLTVSGIAAENFETMPSWSSSFDAAWGSAATWSIVSGGQSGNFLQAARSSGGSSVKAKVYTVPTNTNITVSAYMKCPNFGSSYWMEFACKLGSYTAQDFDANGGTWTMIKKFAYDGVNGNGNVWTQYSSSTINTGANTQITIGYKLGSSGGAGPTVGWDTFRITQQACTAPSITTHPVSQTKNVGESVTFTVAASGTTPLSYQWQKNASNISGATAASYTIASVQSSDAGSYRCVVTNACGSATSNAATLTVNTGPIVSENFDTMPSWSSSFDAAWGSAATWSIVSGGQSGNFLQAARSSQGSSVKAKVYTVPTNTNITVSAYMKCPNFGSSYWMEFACKLGSNTAENFDADPNSWTMIKKFAYDGVNGNGNVWTQYSSSTINTGANTQITIGYKLGSSGGAGPTVGWDTLRIQ